MSEKVTIQSNEELTRSIEITLERYGLGIDSSQVYPSITVDFGTISSPANIGWGDIFDKPDFSEVAFSGDYEDLDNKPKEIEHATIAEIEKILYLNT